MALNILRNTTALFALTLMGAGVVYGQAIVEYGVTTGNSAGAAASPAPLIRMPNFGFPGSSPAGAATAGGAAGVATATPEAIAKTNLQFFQSHSGPSAAQIAVHTVPDRASAWIDGKFVGPAPLTLRLAPGHHQLLVRAPNMHESMQGFDLAAKQTQSIDVALKTANQSQVVIHWAPQKQ